MNFKGHRKVTRKCSMVWWVSTLDFQSSDASSNLDRTKKRRKWCKKVLSSFELASLDWKSRVLTHHTIEPFLVTLRWPLKFILCLSWLGKEKRRKWCKKVLSRFELASLDWKSRVLTHHTIEHFLVTLRWPLKFICYVFHSWERRKEENSAKKVLPRFELASLDWKSRVLTHHTIEPFLVTLRWPLKFIFMAFMVGKRRKEEIVQKVLPRFELASLDWKSRVLTHHTP